MKEITDIYPSEILSLSRTPIVLSEIIKGRSDEWLDSKHGEDNLSPREVLGHFIIGELDDWVPRIRHILDIGEKTPFKPFDVYGGNAMSYDRSVDELLNEFKIQREKSLNDLKSLRISAEDLRRAGTHPKFGKVTLDQLFATWVAHDLYHLGQLFKSFSALYKERVGPWQEFLNLPHFN